MRAIRNVAAAAVVALFSFFLPLPLFELALSLSLRIGAGALEGRPRTALTALAVYLAARGFVNFFVDGAAWIVEPLPLLASGRYLASAAERLKDGVLFAASRLLYFTAALAFLTAPFLPPTLKSLWIPALLIAVGSSLRRIGRGPRHLGAALEALGALSAIAFLVAPLSEEVSNDILYISFISVPAVAIAMSGGASEDYIPTTARAWIAADDKRFREIAEAYVERGDAEAVIAVLSYAYALAGIPLEVAVNEAMALGRAKNKRERKAALEAALAKLRGA